MYFRTLKMIATRGLFLTALECTKFVFPDPDERAYSAPPDPLAGLGDLTSKGRGGRGMKGVGEGSGRTGKGNGRQGEGKESRNNPSINSCIVSVL